MELQTCNNCKRFFNYLTGPHICPACKDILEKKFQEVKEYIRNHPGCSMPMVSENCDVSQRQLKEWLRDERLQFESAESTELTCDSCGTKIRSGRFCDVCKAATMRNLASVLQSNVKQEPVEIQKKPKSQFFTKR